MFRVSQNLKRSWGIPQGSPNEHAMGRTMCYIIHLEYDHSVSNFFLITAHVSSSMPAKMSELGAYTTYIHVC